MRHWHTAGREIADATCRPCVAGTSPRCLGYSLYQRQRIPAHIRARRYEATICSAQKAPSDGGEKYDLVLSSGFLAFASHSGFLQAVEEAGMEVGGVMGTSAGALTGSLYCAGFSPREVAELLSKDRPIQLLRPSKQPWKGGFLTMQPVIERLRELLPPHFEDLKHDFAVGVVTADGQHRIIDSGPLPEAVVASAAIPLIFEGVDIPGNVSKNPCKDGGVVDRIGLKAWRERRRRHSPNGTVPPALVHIISRSSPFSGFDDACATGESNITVVHSPKSGVNFFSLGNFETQMADSLRRARPMLLEAKLRRRQQQQAAAAGAQQPQQQAEATSAAAAAAAPAPSESQPAQAAAAATPAAQAASQPSASSSPASSSSSQGGRSPDRTRPIPSRA